MIKYMWQKGEIIQNYMFIHTLKKKKYMPVVAQQRCEYNMHSNTEKEWLAKESTSF